MSKKLSIKINSFSLFVKLLLMNFKNWIHVQQGQAKNLMMSLLIEIMTKWEWINLITKNNSILGVKSYSTLKKLTVLMKVTQNS